VSATTTAVFAESSGSRTSIATGLAIGIGPVKVSWEWAGVVTKQQTAAIRHESKKCFFMSAFKMDSLSDKNPNANPVQE
jgi:hypothetical protein